MGTVSTFANGTQLTSSAQSPEQVQSIFQQLVIQIFGTGIYNNPQPFGGQYWAPPPAGDPAWKAVRVGFQTKGQPFNGITDDVCFIMAFQQNPPFSRWYDALNNPNDSASVVQDRCYTQRWEIRFVLYGPNAAFRAALIISAIDLDWANDILEASNLYIVPEYNRPRRATEEHGQQWWPRYDFMLQFNEQVNESYVVPLAASADVTIITDEGFQESFTIQN